MKYPYLLLLLITSYCYSQSESQFDTKELFTYQGIKYSIDIESVSLYNYDFWLQTDYPDGKTVLVRMKMSCARKEYDATNYAAFKFDEKIEEGDLKKYNQKIPKDSIFEMILNHICKEE